MKKPTNPEQPVWLVAKIVCLATFFVPLAINAGGSGDKPIDFVPSDLALLLLPFMLMKNISATGGLNRALLIFAIANITFFLAIGAVGVLLQQGHPVPFLSATRAAKCFGQIIIGYELFKRIPQTTIILCIRRIAFFVLASTYISDILFSNSFPSGRWCGNFLGLDIYGFPNSSVFFLVALLPFSLPLPSNSISERITGHLCLLISPVWIVMSLSRNGIVSLAAAFTFSGIRFAKKGKSQLMALVATSATIFILSITCLTVYFDSSELLPELPIERLQARLDRTFDSSDPSSGRFGIWTQALELIAQSPITGYLFEPFSNYNDKYDTPHSQYLEIAFKSGFLGFTLFFTPFLLMYRLAGKLRSKAKSQDLSATASRFQIVLFVALFSSFFQPNFSFPTFANFICVLGGIMARWNNDTYSSTN